VILSSKMPSLRAFLLLCTFCRFAVRATREEKRERNKSAFVLAFALSDQKQKKTLEGCLQP